MYKPTSQTANTFASTFPFFPTHKVRQKNVKELASQHTGHSRPKTEKNNEPLIEETAPPELADGVRLSSASSRTSYHCTL